MKLVKELLAVGLGFGLLGLVISTAFMFLSPNFKLSEYHFWWQVFLSSALTGAIFHLACEATSINKWYCKNGNACQS
jgi:hypothetical protein